MNAGKIGRFNPASDTWSEYVIPTPNSTPTGLMAGPDGNIWFAELGGGKISRISPSGTITEFSVPVLAVLLSHAWPRRSDLVYRPRCQRDRRNRQRRAVSACRLSNPHGPHTPDSITAGADGNVWFNEQFTNKIGRITPAGVIREFTLPQNPSPSGSQAFEIAAGA